jgi:hypothetical protein
MISVYNSSSRYLYIPIVFSSIAYIFIERADDLDHKDFKTHAAILAYDIWVLNQSGANAYLQLAVNANHYKSLSVSIPGTDAFILSRSPVPH